MLLDALVRGRAVAWRLIYFKTIFGRVPFHDRPELRRCATALSSQIKPISYLKAHAAEIIRTLGEHGEPLIITQNGEAKAVVQDIASYEQAQETLALLKILAVGNRQVEEGRIQPAADGLRRLRERSDTAQ